MTQVQLPFSRFIQLPFTRKVHSKKRVLIPFEACSFYLSGRYAYVPAYTGDRLTVVDIAGLDSPSAHIGDMAVGTMGVRENAHVTMTSMWTGDGGGPRRRDSNR